MEDLPLRLSGLAWALWFIYWTIAARGAAVSRWKESLLGRAQHLVPLYFAFYLIFGSTWGPTKFLREHVLPEVLGWPGFAIVLAGLLYSVWARVHLGKYWSGIITLKEGHRLIRTGPYRKIRHPIYTGLIIGTFGAVIAQGRLSGLVAFVIVVAAFVFKLKREEKLLREQFGAEYEQYHQESSALFPGVW